MRPSVTSQITVAQVTVAQPFNKVFCLTQKKPKQTNKQKTKQNPQNDNKTKQKTSVVLTLLIAYLSNIA